MKKTEAQVRLESLLARLGTEIEIWTSKNGLVLDTLGIEQVKVTMVPSRLYKVYGPLKLKGSVDWHVDLEEVERVVACTRSGALLRTALNHVLDDQEKPFNLNSSDMRVHNSDMAGLNRCLAKKGSALRFVVFERHERHGWDHLYRLGTLK